MDVWERMRFLADRPLLLVGADVRTHGDLLEEIERVDSVIGEHPVEPGDVVALTGPYNGQTVGGLLALARRKAVVADLVGTPGSELDEKIREAGCRWRLNTGADGPVLFEVAGCDSRDAAPHPLVRQLKDRGRAGLILFSSGTAGRPKAMLHDFDRLLESYPVGEPKALRVLAFMGLDHIGGIDIFLRAIASGSTLVVPEDRSPAAICGLIETAEVSVLPATPSFLNLVLLSEAWRGRDLSSVKIVAFGAERMPPPVLDRLRAVFPGAAFQQKFGTSETNAIRTLNKPTDPLWIKIDDDSVQWKLVENELWLKTPSRILGYLNHETDRLTADGWYRTGDLVEEDGEGYIRIVGRREALINVGGEKVMPAEVEAVLREFAGVEDCRVFGATNPILGQVVGAEVVMAAGVDPKETARSVKRHCRGRLEPYKVPVKVRLVEEITMTERFKRSIS